VTLERLSLRPAADDDFDALHALFCLPDVYRYLGDGAPPAAEITHEWIRRSHEDCAAVTGVGLWVLETSGPSPWGCVRMHLTDEPRSAELSYVLHPTLWGRGIATAMSWTALESAFGGGGIDRVVAGTDDPNTASLAVMRRLGMRFLRRTQNPRWTGVEYVRERTDPPPDPLPGTVAIRHDG